MLEGEGGRMKLARRWKLREDLTYLAKSYSDLGLRHDFSNPACRLQREKGVWKQARDFGNRTPGFSQADAWRDRRVWTEGVFGSLIADAEMERLGSGSGVGGLMGAMGVCKGRNSMFENSNNYNNNYSYIQVVCENSRKKLQKLLASPCD